LPSMLEQGGGVILNIASTHSFTIIPQTFPYPVAKHALLGLTKSLALEYADKGVRVNALAPGYVETQKVLDYWNSFEDPAEARAKTLALHPGGRIASPQEIAQAAVFMISDECPFMNAACLVVDGGLSQQQHSNN
ncbi:SDR family oxidoreductase, partial [Escherichia coli]|nr:SDR family oxidoreductase [Escherichia coli]